MLQMDPDSRYADVMDEALYNTVLSGMALDGRSFFYVNPLACDPEACKTDARLGHVKHVRQKWFGCACCPPNIARIVSSLGQYIATQTDDTLYLHLYIGSEIKAVLNGRETVLQVDADLLRDGRVTVTVLSGEAEGSIALRLPGWAGGTSIRADQKPASEKEGYVFLTGSWRPGDRITVEFDMLVQAVAASPLVRETSGQVCYAWGPWVYCAEEADNGKKLHLLRACPEVTADVTEKQIGGLTVPALIVPGKRVTVPENAPLYAPWAKPQTTDTKITLIPYFAWNNRGKGEMRVWLETV
jgi:DUF1680 family protein